MPTDPLIPLYAGLYLLALGLIVQAGGQARRFLRATPSIADGEALARFKSFARLNMYLALGQIALLGAGTLVGLVLIFRYGLWALLAASAANAVVFILGKAVGRLETASRNLAGGSPALTEEYQRVNASWRKRPFPDF